MLKTTRCLFVFLLSSALIFTGCQSAPTKTKLILVEEDPSQPQATLKPLENNNNVESQSMDIYAKYPDFIKQVQEKNSDVIGWIKVPNTQINYPIALTDNNDFYINNDIDKNPSKSGAIFLDYRNADESQRRHLILYGHNMKNGSMFNNLNSYKVRDFFSTNSTFVVWLWGEERTYEIYSQFVTTQDVQYINTKFQNDASFLDYFEKLKTQSKFPVSFNLKKHDEILTLSTCTYEYSDESRCVVQARRIK